MARLHQGLAAVALLALLTPLAQATPLAPGGTVSGSTQGNVLASYSGTVVAVTAFQNSTFFLNSPGGPTVGFVSSAAVKTASPFLDFVYQVNVSVGKVTGLSIGSFHNLTTDVSQTASQAGLANTNQFFPGNVTAASYTRSSTTGDTIDVTFSGAGVTSQQASFLVIVHTNSPTFTNSLLSVNGSGTLLSVQTLAPVPEPATILLWGGTLGGMGCFMGWRKRRNTVPASL